MSVSALDLFAGPGGWDEGIRDLGIRPLGIEYDEAACATREAAGHRTLQADVAALDPLDFAPCELLIGSPPCQAFSAAGKKEGREDVPLILDVARGLARGVDDRAEATASCVDPRSLLVVEPLRWALALRSAYIAFEQVPPVLELWQFFADLLRRRGYQVWTGVLSAEQYGVPQTRRRAILLASSSGHVAPPTPTHQAYTPGEPAAEQWTLEGVLRPWVSMADALGWGITAAPSPVVMTARGRQAGPEDALRSSSWRWEWFKREQRAGRWAYDRRQNQGPPGAREPVRLIPVDEPAPTLGAAGLATGRDVWVQRERSGDRSEEGFDPSEMPIEPESQMQNAIRVTLDEAATLQGFPAGYPFQGSRSKQFEQVGNAVPPPLARAVILALVGDTLEVAA